MKPNHLRSVLICLNVLILFAVLTGCSASDTSETAASSSYTIAESGQWTDGTYTATAAGRNGDFEVIVTIEDGALVSVEVGDNDETESRGGVAISTLLPQFVEEQTYDLDAVSGATKTSDALMAAVAECLQAASE